MKKSKYPDDLEIAPRWTVGHWRRLMLDPTKPKSEDWNTALRIFETRIRGRFLNPADVLIAHEVSRYRKTFGFAILAIDFLVIETLQGFYEGKGSHEDTKKEKQVSKGLVVRFLTSWGAFTDCISTHDKAECCGKKIYKDHAKTIYGGYRCALHHTGSTEKELRVAASGPLYKFKSKTDITINRTRFHEELKHRFNSYLDELRESGNVDLRSNFKTKMDWICGIEKNET